MGEDGWLAGEVEEGQEGESREGQGGEEEEGKYMFFRTGDGWTDFALALWTRSLPFRPTRRPPRLWTIYLRFPLAHRLNSFSLKATS